MSVASMLIDIANLIIENADKLENASGNTITITISSGKDCPDCGKCDGGCQE